MKAGGGESRRHSRMQEFPIAVIGAGAIGRTHIDLIRGNPRCRLAAIVDPTPAAQALALELDVPYFSEIDDRLLGAGVRAAILATPTPIHAEHAATCLQLGIPILLEKPVTSTLTEAKPLDQLADDSKVPVLVGHHRRHSTIIAAARDALRKGAVGDINAVSAHFLLGKPDNYFAPEWRRAKDSGGPILTNLIHDLDGLRFLVGEVEQVCATLSPSRRGHSVEDGAAILWRFAAGVIGTVIASDHSPGPFSWEFASGEDPKYDHHLVPSYIVAGTSGTLEIPSLRLWEQRAPVDWHQPLETVRLHVEHDNPLMRQLEHFLDVVENGATPCVTNADATRSLALVQAIVVSARSGGWVNTE